MLARLSLGLTLFFACLGSALAADSAPSFKVPALTGPVVDEGQMLSESAQGQLDQFLRRLKDSGGTQIQVATVSDLGGLSIEEASIKITDEWKLGDAKTDKGVLLLLSKNDRKVRIEVGQGLEGELPDITAGRIVREVIIPRFKEGRIDRGVIDGVLAIVHYTNPEFLEGQNSAGVSGEERRVSGGRGLNGFVTLLIFLFILFSLIGGRRGGGGRGAMTGFVLGSLLGGGRRGGFGGGGFGGGGGSSWGGGGGGFSGGGSSGSW